MKTHSIVVMVLSILIGAIVFISTDCAAPPSSNGTGGGNTNGGGTGGGGTNGGGASPVNKFTIADEHIDFHSWYGEVTWTGSSTLNPVLIVVSTNATPKQWDGSATLGAQGELTAAGITGVSVDAIYSRKFDNANLKTRKVYIPVLDSYSNQTFTDMQTTAGNDRHYEVKDQATENMVQWIMKASTTYYVHLYYQEQGTAKTATHTFTTPAYPTTAAQARMMEQVKEWSDKEIFYNLLATDAASAVEKKASELFAAPNSVYYPVIISSIQLHEISPSTESKMLDYFLGWTVYHSYPANVLIIEFSKGQSTGFKDLFFLVLKDDFHIAKISYNSNQVVYRYTKAITE